MLLGGIVLAGGRSRRMGQPKEALRFLDTTLLGHTVSVLDRCCFPVVVIARDAEQELPPLPIEAEIAYDDEADQGPLAGLAAGLAAVHGHCDAVFATACDAPFLTESAVGWLCGQLGTHAAVMPRIGGVLQPLAAVYRVDVLPTVQRLLAQGERRLHALAEHVDTRILDEAEVDAFDPSRRFLRNVNSPEEYAAVLAEAEGIAGGAAGAPGPH
jgi:molybdopterin-guanine dinucleotide biosynthesis protein A